VEHEDDTEMMEEESERVGRHIEEARDEWDAKQRDTRVPGAQPDPDEETEPVPGAEADEETLRREPGP
jgi:hypothetical protein